VITAIVPVGPAPIYSMLVRGGALDVSDSDFEVLPAGEMRAKYGLTAENRPRIALDAAKVQTALRHLIVLAERFGVADDLIRDDILTKTSAGELEAMSQAVRAFDDTFDESLASPEADGPEVSDEYIAFSCLRMAADCGDRSDLTLDVRAVGRGRHGFGRPNS
jgi:hypothetical protein